VTLRVHPFVGLALAVTCFKKDHASGRRFVVVKHPRDGELLLPLDWTDHGVPETVPVVGGQEVVADVPGLRRLARALAACRKVDSAAGPHVTRARDASPAHPDSGSASGMVRAADDDAAECVGGLGDVGAQGGTTRREKR
jgi:hypothetical protein